MSAVRSLPMLLACLCAAGLCTACSAQAPPEDATHAVPLPPVAPAIPETAPVFPAPAAQATPPPVPTAQPALADAPQAAAIPAPTPAPVKRPAPTLVRPASILRPLPASTGGSSSVQPVHATVTALSRGKGVPTESREALKRIRALLETRQASASVTAVHVQRIGLEGESRLCIEFPTAADAQAVLAEMRRIAGGSDLLDISETSCPLRKE